MTGILPKVIPSAEDKRTTIEKWRDRFLENARKKRKRSYVTLRIPPEVALRVKRRLS